MRFVRHTFLCLLLFSLLYVFSSCGDAPAPREALMKALSEVAGVPAGKIYSDTDAPILRDGVAVLYGNTATAGFAAADGYALYLGLSPDTVTEIAVFRARDGAGVREILTMLLSRRDFLGKNFRLPENEFFLRSRGNLVFAFYGLSEEQANALFRAALRAP